MNRRAIRIVSWLLVPAVLIDPAAAAIPAMRHQSVGSTRNPFSKMPFNEQALSQGPVLFGGHTYHTASELSLLHDVPLSAPGDSPYTLVTEKPTGSDSIPKDTKPELMRREAEKAYTTWSVKQRKFLAQVLVSGKQSENPEFKLGFPLFKGKIQLVKSIILQEPISKKMRKNVRLPPSVRLPRHIEIRQLLEPIFDPKTQLPMGAIGYKNGDIFYLYLPPSDQDLYIQFAQGAFHEFDEYVLLPHDSSIEPRHRHTAAVLEATGLADGWITPRDRQQINEMQVNPFIGHLSIRELLDGLEKVKKEIVEEKYPDRPELGPVNRHRQNYALARALAYNHWLDEVVFERFFEGLSPFHQENVAKLMLAVIHQKPTMLESYNHVSLTKENIRTYIELIREGASASDLLAKTKVKLLRLFPGKGAAARGESSDYSLVRLNNLMIAFRGDGPGAQWKQAAELLNEYIHRIRTEIILSPEGYQQAAAELIDKHRFEQLLKHIERASEFGLNLGHYVVGWKVTDSARFELLLKLMVQYAFNFPNRAIQWSDYFGPVDRLVLTEAIEVHTEKKIPKISGTDELRKSARLLVGQLKPWQNGGSNEQGSSTLELWIAKMMLSAWARLAGRLSLRRSA